MQLQPTQFFQQWKFFLVVVAASPCSITKVKVFDKVYISLSSVSGWFSKCLCKACLNKSILKCKTFILTASEVTCTRTHVFFSYSPQAYLYTQTFCITYHCPFKLTRPLGRFLSTAIAHTSLLFHTDVLFPLPRPTQANPTTRTFPLQWHSIALT